LSTLIASSAIASLSLTWYEINIVYIPIALFTIASFRRRDWRVGVAVTTIPFLLYLGATVWLKNSSPHEYAGASVGTAALLLPTYCKQLLATFPGTFYGLIGDVSLPVDQLLTYALGNIVAVLASALWMLCFLLTLGMVGVPVPSRQRRVVVFMGLVLLLMPPMFIAISSKYQQELTWGSAHIPVYYQYFGLAILATMSLEKLLSPKAQIAVVAVASVLAVWVGLNWSVNNKQSEKLDIAFREPRDSFVLALKNGILDPVRDGDIVKIENQPLFINGNLIYQVTRKNVSVPGEIAIAGWFVSRPRADARRYSLIREAVPGSPWKLVVEP
jgi:hypothetical protein